VVFAIGWKGDTSHYWLFFWYEWEGVNVINMNIERFREYCMSKIGVSEEFPFDHKTLVFKVAGKMFALTDVDDFTSINLKCDPEMAVELREQFDAVAPGYHMNKKHWNTITIDGSFSEVLLQQWIDNSYDLVVDKLSKKEKALLSSFL